MCSSKNRTREERVAQIEDQYRWDLEKAERIVQEKKAKKAGYRYQGAIAIGGSVSFIAIIALLLVLLSIQRNVREIKANTVEKTD